MSINSISHAYGIASGSSLTTMNQASLNTQLQAIAKLGVTWIRYDFDWSQIQPDNSQKYDWSQYDMLVSLSNKYHLHILGILDYTPAWARPINCNNAKCAPANPANFATFAATVAKRYGTNRVAAWEIWNEPNSVNFWQPTSSPVLYTKLLRLTYGAIKSVEPNVVILTGGLSPQSTDGQSYSPLDFLNAIYAQGARPYFDAVADQPYTFPLSPSSNADDAWNQMASGTNSLRESMVVEGDAQKKIWITEFGAPTGGPGPISTITDPNLTNQPYVVDESLQAKILTDALILYKQYSWAGPFFVYTYQDAGTDQSTNENFFGLVRYDGSPKPAYDAFVTAINAR